MIFFLFSCQNSTLDIKGYLEYHFISADKIRASEVLRSHKAIQNLPRSTWFTLLSFELFDRDGTRKKICINFKTASNTDDNNYVLNVYNLESNQNCGPILNQKAIISLSSLKALNYRLNLKNNKQHQDSINIHFIQGDEKEQKKVNIELISLNLTRSQLYKSLAINWKKNKLNLYDDSLISKYQKGAWILPLHIGGKKKFKDIHLIKHFDYTKDSTLFCQKVNDQCENKIIPSCEQCRYGSFAVIASKCQKRVSRYCGNYQCGQVNSPACIRSLVGMKKENKGHCKNPELFGFCKTGLVPQCDKNRVLICRATKKSSL